MQGVSTRSVDDLVKAMGMTGISKSQVSRLCAEIDERVKGFLERPIEGSWPYLWIDATYVKVRESGRIVSVAVIIAVGVNGDGRREVLDAYGNRDTDCFANAAPDACRNIDEYCNPDIDCTHRPDTDTYLDTDAAVRAATAES